MTLTPIRIAILVAALLIPAVFALDALRDEPVSSVVRTIEKRAEPVAEDIDWIEVRRGDDADKAGANRGVIGQRFFTQDDYTCGRSGDQLRFRFDEPATVLGVNISVDINGTLGLVEFVAGIGNETGYATDDRDADWLLHTSWTGDAPSQIDEHVVLPFGIDVAAGDYVGVGAWLCSVGTNGRTSPEIIVWYRWAD